MLAPSRDQWCVRVGANISKSGRYKLEYKAGFAQFGLDVFKQGQTRFCQFPLPLDPAVLEKCFFDRSISWIVENL